MPVDNVIFPEPFKLSSRNPLGLEKRKQQEGIYNFQVAVFEAAKRAASKLRPFSLPAHAKLLRNVPEEYGKTGDQARTLPPDSSRNTKVRWSGLISPPKDADTSTLLKRPEISKGALYTSLDAEGLLSEALRYRREKITRSVAWAGSPTGEATYTVFGPTSKNYYQLIVGRVYYTFKLKQSVRLVDLTPSVAADFYDAIETDRQYQAAKRDLRLNVPLSRIAFDPVDYTGSRPLGLSVLLGTVAQGVQVKTAQSELPELGSAGTNVILGGEDGKPVGILAPVGRLIAGISEGQTALLEIKLQPGGIDPAVVMRGSVLLTDPK